MIDLVVNGKKVSVDASPDSSLLWVIRDVLNFSGTKYGCGQGVCGACTVQIDGKVERSCQFQIKDVQGKSVTTIEGIPEEHPLKKAWIAEEVSQCGYCQPGQIVAAEALLRQKPQPNEGDIDSAMDGNLCRCGTYHRIKRAIHAASKISNEGGAK